MKLLKCKNCGGSDLRSFSSRNDLVQCTYCGSIYKLDSKGNISNQEILETIPNFLKIILAFIFLSCLIGIANLIVSSSKKDPTSVKTSTSDTNHTEHTDQSISNDKKEIELAEGEITEMYDYEILDYYYIVGFYKNTGKTILNQPKIEVSFYNKNDQLVDTVNGFGFKHFLEPQEITSFYVITKKKNKIFHKEIKHYPEAARYIQRRAKIEILESKLKKEGFESIVLGRLQNLGETKAKLVSIKAVFFDKDKKIIGQNFSYINEKVLNPNQIAIFKVSIYLDIPTVDYWLETWGHE